MALKAGRTLQVKPTNLEAAAQPVAELSAADLSSLTIQSHAALTPAHAARVVELLRAPSSAVEAGCLLRCCTCIQWLLPSSRDVASGKETLFTFTPPAQDDNGTPPAGQKGLVLFSDAAKLVPFRAFHPPPAGAKHSALGSCGAALFNRSMLEGVALISLDPLLGDSSSTSVFTQLPAAYFAPSAAMLNARRACARGSRAHAAPSRAPGHLASPRMWQREARRRLRAAIVPLLCLPLLVSACHQLDAHVRGHRVRGSDAHGSRGM